MKKILFSIAAICLGYGSFAQYKDVEKFFLLTKYEDAKREIDKLSVDPKTKDKRETILWKAKVYSQIFGSQELALKYPTSGVDAYEALNAYRGTDTSTAWAKENSAIVEALYGANWNLGVTAFNAKKWDEAYQYFVIAEDMGDVVSRAGLTNNPKQKIDTIRVFFAGAAAQNSGKKDIAIKYYTKIANEKVNDKDYLDVYKFILAYYMEKKDEANFNKYLAVANEVFPNQKSLWNDYQAQYISDNLDPKEIMARYKQEDAAGKLTPEEYASYGQTLGNPGKEAQAKMDSLTLSEMKKLAAEAFKKSFATSKNGLEAFNVAVMYYNEWNVLDERYAANKGATPALKAKREEIEKQQHIVANEAIEWMNKAYEILKLKSPRERVEVSTLNRSIDFLANLYLWKREKARGKAPKDYDVFDAKFKLFDAEHGKYKD